MSEEKDYRRQLMEALKKKAEIFDPLTISSLMISFFDQKEVGLDLVVMLFNMRELEIKRITSNCEKVWGMTKEEMEGINITPLIHPKDLEISIGLAHKSLVEYAPIINYKNRHYDKEGNVVHLNWNTTGTINGECICFIKKYKP